MNPTVKCKKPLLEFSEEWEPYSIRELEAKGMLTLDRGQVISRKDVERTPGDYPIYSSSVVNRGRFACYGSFMFDEELITWSIDGGGNFFYQPKHRFSVTNVCGYMRVDTRRINYRFLAGQLEVLHARLRFDYQTKAHPSVIRGLYTVALPSIEEQTAIAEAISDADALISSLDKLIAKKRDIRNGAMQVLLTGKKRLPGFSGEWQKRMLGQLGTCRGGNGFPIRYQGSTSGDYPFFKVSDISNEGNDTTLVNSKNWIDEGIRRKLRAEVFPNHTVVFAKIGAAMFLERKRLLGQASCIDNNMMGFIVNENAANCRYAHNLLLTTQLSKLAHTSAVPSLTGKYVEELGFRIPGIEEQAAIAQVLSDMDREMDELERKLEKCRLIKQGMMQELLTGKKRVI